MKSHISIITLGVSDLEASIRFYRDGLKLPMRDKGEENIAFLKCRALGWRFIRAKKLPMS